MEIFQTIWSALTTENVTLTNIISIPLGFIEATLTVLLFTTLLNIKSNKQQKLIYVLSFSIIAITSLFFVPKPYNTFLNVIALPILVLIIFKTNLLKAILSEIISYIFFVIVGSIIMGVLICFSKYFVYATTAVPLYKLCYSLLLYLLIYLIYRLFNHYNISISILDKLKQKINYRLIFNIIIGLIAVALQSYIAMTYIDKLPFSIVLASLLCLFLYFLLNMYGIFRTNKLEETTEKLEEEKLYNKTLNILYDNIRGFKHDFQNIMHAIGGYITRNNMEGLRTYYQDLLPDSLKINQLDILNPESINNPAIYSVLTSKYHKADELGITMNVEAFLNMQTINMKIYELTRILGILLDNAIEAAKDCDKKLINVTIRKDNSTNMQLFIVENTYLNKDINVDRIFEKGYTSKKTDDKTSHGLGLWEVRKILKRNNNLNLFTSKNDNLFSQQLEIYC